MPSERLRRVPSPPLQYASDPTTGRLRHGPAAVHWQGQQRRPGADDLDSWLVLKESGAKGYGRGVIPAAYHGAGFHLYRLVAGTVGDEQVEVEYVVGFPVRQAKHERPRA